MTNINPLFAPMLPEEIAREFIGHLGAVVANRDLWETADSPIAYDEPLESEL